MCFYWLCCVAYLLHLSYDNPEYSAADTKSLFLLHFWCISLAQSSSKQNRKSDTNATLKHPFNFQNKTLCVYAWSYFINKMSLLWLKLNISSILLCFSLASSLIQHLAVQSPVLVLFWRLRCCILGCIQTKSGDPVKHPRVVLWWECYSNNITGCTVWSQVVYSMPIPPSI